MSRKNSILIISAIILLMIGGLIIFYFSSNKTNNVVNLTPTTNPFGTAPANNNYNSVTQTTGNNQTAATKNLAKLIQLYRNPTSGSIFFARNGQDTLRFVDRAVGNIYEYVPSTQTGEVQRVTNTTIPKIQETAWSSAGSDLVFRYLDNDTDNIISFSAKVKGSLSSTTGSIGEITGTFLPTNIKQLAISPSGNKIFGLVDKSDRSGTYGFTTNLDGSGKKVVFNSPISYWNISWPKENIVTFTTKPSYKDVGLLYFFNTQTSSLDRILGDITGMSTVTNSDASLVAYSQSENNSFFLDVYDVINKIDKNLQIATLADKCVWGNNDSKVLYCAVPQTIPADNYPDAWYQGLESFSDDIWKIDTGTGKMTELYQIGSNENANIDAYNMVISPNDRYLAFINKTDLSLWLLDINQK